MGRGKLHTRSLQVNAACHCNLRCADCSHLSPYASPRFASPARLAADLQRLSGVLHTGSFILLGGEPLLNPELGELARVARASGIADRIVVNTNGLLLDRAEDSFWRHVDVVAVSVYPEVPPDESVLVAMAARASATDTILSIRPQPQFRSAVVAQPHASAMLTNLIYQSCVLAHVARCHMLDEGRIYRCALPAGLGQYLCQVRGVGYDAAADGVTIHDCADLRGELQRYLHSRRPLTCCRHCLGTAGVRRPHRQLSAQELTRPEATTPVCGSPLSARHLVGGLVRRARRGLGDALGRRHG